MSDFTKEELIAKVEAIRYRTESTIVEHGSAFDNPAILLGLILDFSVNFEFDEEGGVYIEVYAFDAAEQGYICYPVLCADKKNETIAAAVCDLVIKKYEIENDKEDH